MFRNNGRWSVTYTTYHCLRTAGSSGCFNNQIQPLPSEGTEGAEGTTVGGANGPISALDTIGYKFTHSDHRKQGCPGCHFRFLSTGHRYCTPTISGNPGLNGEVGGLEMHCGRRQCTVGEDSSCGILLVSSPADVKVCWCVSRMLLGTTIFRGTGGEGQPEDLEIRKRAVGGKTIH